MNKVILDGRLGADPTVRSTRSGKEVATLNVATSEKRTDTTITEWHRVVVWGDGRTRGLKKGSRVVLAGKLRTRKWEDKTGAQQYTTEVIADWLESPQRIKNEAPGSEQEFGDTPSFDDEEPIPF